MLEKYFPLVYWFTHPGGCTEYFEESPYIERIGAVVLIALIALLVYKTKNRQAQGIVLVLALALLIWTELQLDREKPQGLSVLGVMGWGLPAAIAALGILFGWAGRLVRRIILKRKQRKE